MKVNLANNGMLVMQANTKKAGDFELVKKIADKFFAVAEGYYVPNDICEVEQYIEICCFPSAGSRIELRQQYAIFKAEVVNEK